MKRYSLSWGSEGRMYKRVNWEGDVIGGPVVFFHWMNQTQENYYNSIIALNHSHVTIDEITDSWFCVRIVIVMLAFLVMTHTFLHSCLCFWVDCEDASQFIVILWIRYYGSERAGLRMPLLTAFVILVKEGTFSHLNKGPSKNQTFSLHSATKLSYVV